MCDWFLPYPRLVMFTSTSTARKPLVSRQELILADEEAQLHERLKELEHDLSLDAEENRNTFRMATWLVGAVTLLIATFGILAYHGGAQKSQYHLVNPKLHATGAGRIDPIRPGSAAHVGQANASIVELAQASATPSEQMSERKWNADPRAQLAGVIVGYGKDGGLAKPQQRYPCHVAHEAHKCDLNVIEQDAHALLRCTRIKRVCPWLFPDHKGGPAEIDPERYDSLREYIDLGGEYRDPFRPPPPAPRPPSSPSPPPYGYSLFDDRHDPKNMQLSGGDRFAEPLGGKAAPDEGLMSQGAEVFAPSPPGAPESPERPSLFADVLKGLDDKYGSAGT